MPTLRSALFPLPSMTRALLAAAVVTPLLLGLAACSSASSASAAPGKKPQAATAQAAQAGKPSTKPTDATPAAAGDSAADETVASSSATAGGKLHDHTTEHEHEAKGPRLVELVINANTAEDPSPENPLGPSRRNFRSKLLLLRKIASDPDVAGVRLVLKGNPGYAHAIDLQDELRKLKAAGKKVVCYAEVLSQGDLMFASAADVLVVPPSGMIVLEGLQAELFYLKDLLDKIDVKFEVLHVGNYKTAFEDLSRNAMSPEQREVIGLLLDEFYNQLLDTIAANRKVERSVVEAAFQEVLVMPEDAAKSGLISAVAFEDEFDAKVEALLGAKPQLVENYGDKSAEDMEKMLGNPFAAFALLPKLLNPPKQEAPDEPYVAIVYATGAINSGKSTAGWDGTVSSMGSETIVEALEKTLEDDHCKAVVFRVNSPGGSALASDMIWRAIERVKEKKKVVASMGSVAGSGGYWISMGCDAIVAQPSTITGSMGVVSMLPNFSQALKDLGINVEVVARGPHGDQMSLLKHGPTQVLRDTINKMMNDVYADFIDKASTGRRMDKVKLETLARGRVWTGRQAEELGLVDQLGGLQDAINLACVMAGNLNATTTPIMEYPQAPSFMEAMEEAFGGMAQLGTAPGGALGTGLGLASGSALSRGELATVATWLASQPAFAPFLSLVAKQLADTDPLSADRVQCVMPFAISVR
jgi:protease IV